MSREQAMTDERLRDLVRYARSFLFTENLISEEEYVALATDNDNGQRVARLETYDALRERVAELEATQAELSAYCKKDVDLALWMLAKERARVEELRRKLAELEADIERRQSEEASVCPEDVGIVEYVGALKQRIAALEAALDSARRSK